MSRARRRPLEAIPEDAGPAPEAPAGPVNEIMRLIDGLEKSGEPARGGGTRGRQQRRAGQPRPLRAVEDRVSAIMSAAEDAIVALKNECRRQLIVVPKKARPGGAGGAAAARVRSSAVPCKAGC